MQRQFIWMQAALCAVTFSVAAPVLAGAHGQPPPHAQANGHDKDKNKDKDKKAKKAQPQEHAVHAQDHPQPRPPKAWDPRFHGLDRNNNGIVSRREWNGDDRSFAQHDWNRDGVLSGDELIAGATRPTTPAHATKPHTESDEVLFARMDVNRDNKLSRGEWTGNAGTFDRIDFNKDGVLSPYEFGVGR